ncbi:MAG: 3-phosphoshikimate 1-carboxyvinyltransferase [Bacteroidales bacterium]|nr:3-phosphoshikimate 1-carboxyvinyltransferase [Bacteroidales bacterium]
MDLTVYPSRISGVVTANPSKSHMQRVIVACLLAGGRSVISNPSFCDDAKAALSVAVDLGAKVKVEKNRVIISGGFDPVGNTLNCGESGLGLRMFSAVAALSGKEITLVGHGTLKSRSVAMIEKPLTDLGARVTLKQGKLPVTVCGPITGGKAMVDGSLSSQFLTGLLIALPLAEKDSELIVNNLKSRFYIDLTIKVLKDFGIEILNNEYKHFIIPGSQVFISGEYEIEGDWSGAAFLLVAGAIGGEVKIENLDINSNQADRRILDVLEQFGARVKKSNNGIRVIKAEMKPFNFDATDSPDLFPPLVVLASYAKGKSRIKGISRLAGKESNRAEALIEEFAKVGIQIETDDENMIVYGGIVTGGTINSRNDHRIAMAAAVAGVGAGGNINIQGYECISKSYPDFFTDYQKTGGKINE